MFKRWTWYSIMFLAIAGGATLSVGFVKALQVTNTGNVAVVSKTTIVENKATPTPATQKKPNSIQIVVMGDSVARGTGDEKGKGFSTYLPGFLKTQTAKELSVENIAIDGLKTTGLMEQLQNKQLKQLLATSDFVLVSIGGNDLRSLRATDDTTKESEFKVLEENYLTNLKEILRTIRISNSNTCIVLVGLYNPYEKAASFSQDTKLVNAWNFETQQIIEADAKAIFIPTYDLFKFNLQRYIASDGLHPNSLGYQAASSRIAKTIENTLN